MELNRLRKEYESGELRRKDLSPSPFEQLQNWLQLAIDAHLIEPHAMCLATATADGYPSNRIVLLRHLDEKGLVFFTNYESRKGTEIQQNPRASCVFWWGAFEKQVIVQGPVEKISQHESDEYFAGRPRKSQIAAWSSRQDKVLSNREELEQAFADNEKKFEGESVARPPNWGGFRLVPERFEFWQGRRSRLHDRFEYVRKEGGWSIQRLSP